jgi:hypothetical protein
MDANAPAEGSYEMMFSLWDDPYEVNDVNQVGVEVNVPDVELVDGYFTVLLDFNDPNAFNGQRRWLEVGVRNDPISSYTWLSPRQEMAALPYALHSRTVSAPLLLLADPPPAAAVLGVGVVGDGVAIGTTTPGGDIALLSKSAVDDVPGSAVVGISPAGYGGYFNGMGYFSGDVGIGVEPPSEKLEVDGTVKATAFIGDGNGLTNLQGSVVSGAVDLSADVAFDGAVVSGINTGTGYGVYGYGRDANSCGVFGVSNGGYGIGGSSATTGNVGYLGGRYGVYGYSPSGLAAYFNGPGYFSGDVGIGVETPSEKLEVDGTVKATAFVGDGSGLTGLSAGGDSDWTISGNNMYSAVSGNVGIGTTSPDRKLSVLTDTRQSAIEGEATRTSAEKYGVSGIASGNSYYPSYGIYGKSTGLNGYSHGVFGITDAWTTDPSYGVRGVSRSPWGANYGLHGEATEASSGNNYGVYAEVSNTGTGVAYAGYFNGGKNYFSGNVGIGTTTPTEELEVNGNVKADNLSGCAYTDMSTSILDIPTTWYDLQSVTLTLKASGYVIVSFTGHVRIDAAGDEVTMGIGTAPGSTSLVQYCESQSTGDKIPFNIQYVYDIASAGTYTYYGNVKSTLEESDIYGARMTAIYVPNRY